MKLSTRLLLSTSLSVFLAMISASARAQTSTSGARTALTYSACARDAYLLQPGDVIEVQMPFAPDYNENATVQPDGRISLRERSSVEVANLTLAQAEKQIEHVYLGLLRDPEVSVLLKEFLKPSFYASGEIGHPGRYEVRGKLNMLEALSEAGGLLTERARKREIIRFRPQCNGFYESTVIDVKKLLQSKGQVSLEEYTILPGDILYVPQNRSSKVQRYIPTPSVGAFLSPTNL